MITSIVFQVLPFVLILVYLALAIFLLRLIARFVAAHERMASAMEQTASQLQRVAEAGKPPQAPL